MKPLHLVRLAILLLFTSLASLAFAGPRASFPMRPDAYRAVLQQRIDGIWGVIERKLTAHNVSAQRKKEIRAMLDDSAKDVWAAFNKAAADGSISREEADRLREATRGLRAKVRSRMAAERRGQDDKAKPKDNKPAPEARHADRPRPPAAAPSGSHKAPPAAASRRTPPPAPAAPPSHAAKRRAPAAAPAPAAPHAKKNNDALSRRRKLATCSSQQEREHGMPEPG